MEKRGSCVENQVSASTQDVLYVENQAFYVEIHGFFAEIEAFHVDVWSEVSTYCVFLSAKEELYVEEKIEIAA